MRSLADPCLIGNSPPSRVVYAARISLPAFSAGDWDARVAGVVPVQMATKLLKPRLDPCGTKAA
jgi:hypothetical protein